ncbi:DinB family protein [Streptomyces profundus]|uniref:DinB family protein n=1 Tax=Streptomyces profundus TaxID=2867410 RepID=UPI001D15E728|nr:DinB family protein [Streptomyces sp. MA3_2.13]UED87216.1 DinB family protein [Streptomyces sp. MA3_2.13]
MTEGPGREITDPRALLIGYLDACRRALWDKLSGLDEEELGTARVPSAWTPAQLVWHLTLMERRWLVWGFRAEPVDGPWDDHDADGRWTLPEGITVAELRRRYWEQAERSRQAIGDAELTERAAIGGRFDGTAETPPTLGWILLHLLQEYARHLGHLDVSRELADGTVGE